MLPGIYATAVAPTVHPTMQPAHHARAPTVHNKYLHRFVKGLRFWGVSAGLSCSLKALQAHKHTHTHQHTCICNSLCVCVWECALVCVRHACGWAKLIKIRPACSMSNVLLLSVDSAYTHTHTHTLMYLNRQIGGCVCVSVCVGAAMTDCSFGWTAQANLLTVSE